MNESQSAQESPRRLFAIVELFGHARIAGQVSEQTFGGSTFMRVDVPEVIVSGYRYDDGERVATRRVIAAHTRSFGGGAIYAINWCDEMTATIAAQQIEDEPMRPYSVADALRHLPDSDRTRLLGSAKETDEDDPL